MKRFICTALFLFVIGTCLKAQGFLRASGKQIVDEKGNNVLLRGIGLGGWMLQEGYMLKLQGVNPQYSIRKRMEALIGSAQTEEFYTAWRYNFITKADIDSLHAWGFNSVRLPLHYNLFTPPVEQEPDSSRQTWLATGFRLTDSLLSWCRQNGMYLILDLHAAPGGQGNDFNIADRDSTRPSLWQSEAAQAKTIALWKKLAERYKDEPNIGGYDLLNEPNWGFEQANDLHGQKETGNKPLRALLVKLTEAVRSIDRKHIIIIEGNAWGNNYKGVFPLWDDNTVISFHKYWNYNDAASIKGMLEARDQNNAPIWIGETGENSNTWFTDAVQLFEQNNIGWSWWPLKKIGINNPLEIKPGDDYSKLAAYWNGNSANPPSKEQAFAALMSLAAATHIRSNIIHYDVIDALLRQPFHTETRPFKPNSISSKDSLINAVDFDLGRNGLAYYDKDSGNYYVATGHRSAGNKGSVYRNDGVDISPDPAGSGYHLISVEDGEWMQYTVSVKESGRYRFGLSAGAATPGILSVYIDNQLAFPAWVLKPTKSDSGWTMQFFDYNTTRLREGTHTIKLMVVKGGFYLSQILVKKIGD